MRIVFLIDLDNTLIDNDAARERLWNETDRVLGPVRSKKFWSLYEDVRNDRGYVDFLETLSRFHSLDPDAGSDLDRAVLDFPYVEFRYPDAFRAIEALWVHGSVVVLSDGDPVFQPLKIARSGVAGAVRGNVLVFAHKEGRLDDVSRLFPAERYVAIDDKADVLARIKVHWGARVRTVHVLQGKYADDAYDGPPPDLTLRRIGDLLTGSGTAALSSLFGPETKIPAHGGERRGG